jgi:hypothetical protein
MAVINLQPQTLDLVLYAGDGVGLRFLCKDPTGAPIDVTGGVRAHIRADRSSEAPIIEQFAVSMVDAYLGLIVLKLTGEQTQNLAEPSGKFVGVWDLEWDASEDEPRTLVQGRLECVADVTR